MPCPYLEGKILKKCAAFKGTIILSVGELKDYCATSESFKECQLFKELLLLINRADNVEK
jgi:hypothetical protein